jgi:hypothetical protein
MHRSGNDLALRAQILSVRLARDKFLHKTRLQRRRPRPHHSCGDAALARHGVLGSGLGVAGVSTAPGKVFSITIKLTAAPMGRLRLHSVLSRSAWQQQ